jgi:hypothetical protein
LVRIEENLIYLTESKHEDLGYTEHEYNIRINEVELLILNLKNKIILAQTDNLI